MDAERWERIWSVLMQGQNVLARRLGECLERLRDRMGLGSHDWYDLLHGFARSAHIFATKSQ